MRFWPLALLTSFVLIVAASAEIAASPQLVASPQRSISEALVIAQPQTPVVRQREERELVADVNELRVSQGVPEVALDDALSRAAHAHAFDMAQHRFFGHDSPDGRSLPDRLAAVGFHWVVAAENIALEEDERHAHAALVRSAAHRANMLDPRVRKIGVAALGVGVGAALYVEDFAL